ncbi:hypothetical protein, partial [Pseudoalteromonas sp.]|uniref:hypothetical protein n=1 Tax=Pseudoalteromonas sp. TaxID=53249 RepID=UPI00260F6B4D
SCNYGSKMVTLTDFKSILQVVYITIFRWASALICQCPSLELTWLKLVITGFLFRLMTVNRFCSSFTYQNASALSNSPVVSCREWSSASVATKTGEFQAFRNYSIDPKFEEFFLLLRHDSCFYFTTVALEFDTNNYYVYDGIVDINAPNSNDTDEY